jgi:IclR family transcriptional regulator, KDG regulon repressor
MVQSINRAFEIVHLVAASDAGIRLQELTEQCKLKKTTIYNLAETLVKEGMLSKNANSHYQLGELVTELYLGKHCGRNLHRAAEILTELHLQFPTTEIIYTELGEADIFGRLHMPAGEPGKIVFTDGITFNPYLTVCGILYFAFVPDERLNGLRIRNPFEFKGIDVWGSEEAFQECVAVTRDCGWAKIPTIIEPKRIKVGVPVLGPRGNLLTTITLIEPRNGLPRENLIIKELLATAKRIGQP